MNKVIKRMKKPTPTFFQKLRNVGLVVAAAGAAILAAPIDLPMVVVKIAGYLTVAGGVMSGVSQTAIKNERQ